MFAPSAANLRRRWSSGVLPIKSAKAVPDGTAFLDFSDFARNRYVCNSAGIVCLCPRLGVYGGGQPVGGALHHLVLCAAGAAAVGRGGYCGTLLPCAAPAYAGVSGGGAFAYLHRRGRGAGRGGDQSGSGAGGLPAAPAARRGASGRVYPQMRTAVGGVRRRHAVCARRQAELHRHRHPDGTVCGFCAAKHRLPV